MWPSTRDLGAGALLKKEGSLYMFFASHQKSGDHAVRAHDKAGCAGREVSRVGSTIGLGAVDWEGGNLSICSGHPNDLKYQMSADGRQRQFLLKVICDLVKIDSCESAHAKTRRPEGIHRIARIEV